MADRTTQNQSLSSSIGRLRSAEDELHAASQQTADPVKLLQINAEFTFLDSWISRLLHAQAQADDALFAGEVASLKQQAANLTAEEAHIQKIVGDAAKAGSIVAGIAQAVAAIAAL